MSAVTDTMIKECLLQSTLLEIAEIEALDYEGIAPTDEFKNRIKSILHPPIKKKLSIKRLTIILVAAILISLSVMFTVSAKLRSYVVDFVRDFFIEEHEDHSVFYANTSTSTDTAVSYPEKIETVYTFGYIEQNGYTEIYCDLANSSVATAWEKDGFIIDLTQSLTNTNGIIMDTEDANYTVKHLDGMELYTTSKEGIYTVLWLEHGYIFTMTFDEALGWEEAEKIILSLYAPNT